MSDFQPAKIFLLSPVLLEIHVLANFSKELAKGFGDRIVIPIDHLATSPDGWVQDAIKTLPGVDIEGKHWEKHLTEGIARVQPLVGRILTLS